MPAMTDTTGPADSGPPTHTHPWEEVYFVLAGELEVTVGDNESQTLSAGGVAHIPAGTPHGYRNVTRDTAARFFEKVSSEVEMIPPDIAGVTRVGLEHGIVFLD